MVNIRQEYLSIKIKRLKGNFLLAKVILIKVDLVFEKLAKGSLEDVSKKLSEWPEID